MTIGHKTLPVKPTKPTQLEVEVLARHAGDHIADARAIVEAVMQQHRLRLPRFDREEAERGTQQAAACICPPGLVVLHSRFDA